MENMSLCSQPFINMREIIRKSTMYENGKGTYFVPNIKHR